MRRSDGLGGWCGGGGEVAEERLGGGGAVGGGGVGGGVRVVVGVERAVHGAAARDRIGRWKRAERGGAAGQRSRKRLLGRFGFAQLDVYN